MYQYIVSRKHIVVYIAISVIDIIIHLTVICKSVVSESTNFILYITILEYLLDGTTKVPIL